MAIIKKSMNNKCWRGVKKREPSCIIGGNVNWYSHYGEQYRDFLKKLGIKLPYDPTIPLMIIYPKETRIEKDTCTIMFTAALFTVAQTWKKLRCPLTDEWIKKLLYIYTMKYSVQFSSVAQSCLTLWDPMNRACQASLSITNSRSSLKTHVHRASDAIQPSHPLSSPSPPAPNPSQHQGLFQWVNSSHEVAIVLEFQL